jgi:uncharacterized membrane protein
MSDSDLEKKMRRTKTMARYFGYAAVVMAILTLIQFTQDRSYIAIPTGFTALFIILAAVTRRRLRQAEQTGEKD